MRGDKMVVLDHPSVLPQGSKVTGEEDCVEEEEYSSLGNMLHGMTVQ
jgi:hypothetical protein